MARVIWDQTYVKRTLRPAIRDAFVDYGREYVRDVRANISTPYPPASRPGEPPHRRRGRLRSSMRATVFVDSNDVVLQAGSDLKYSTFLEVGTSRMAARPYLRPAQRRTVGALNKRLRAIDRRLPKVSAGFRGA